MDSISEVPGAIERELDEEEEEEVYCEGMKW